MKLLHALPGLFVLGVAGSRVTQGPPSVLPRFFTTTTMAFTDDDYELNESTELTLFNSDWCRRGCPGPSLEDLSSGKYNGTIVIQDNYYESCFKCDYCALAKWGRQLDAKAVLLFSILVPGHGRHVFHDRNLCDQAKHYPVLEIGMNEAVMILTAMRSTTVKMTLAGSFNEWQYMFDHSWIYMQAFTSFYSLLISMYAIKKFYNFVAVRKSLRKQELELNTRALWVLGIQIVVSVIRTMYVAVDPFWSRGIFPFWFSRIVVTGTLPISIMSAIVIIVTWRTILFAAFKSQRTFWFNIVNFAFCAVGLVFCMLDLVSACLVTYGGHIDFSVKSLYFLATFCWITAVVVIVYGYFMVRRLRMFSSDTKSVNKIWMLTIRIVWIAIALILSGIATVLFTDYHNLFDPGNRLRLSWFLFFSLSFQSHMIVAFYRTPRIPPRRSSSMSSATNIKTLDRKYSDGVAQSAAKPSVSKGISLKQNYGDGVVAQV